MSPSEHRSLSATEDVLNKWVKPTRCLLCADTRRRSLVTAVASSSSFASTARPAIIIMHCTLVAPCENVRARKERNASSLSCNDRTTMKRARVTIIKSACACENIYNPQLVYPTASSSQHQRSAQSQRSHAGWQMHTSRSSNTRCGSIDLQACPPVRRRRRGRPRSNLPSHTRTRTVLRFHTGCWCVHAPSLKYLFPHMCTRHV